MTSRWRRSLLAARRAQHGVSSERGYPCCAQRGAGRVSVPTLRAGADSVGSAHYHRDRPGMSAFALADGVVYHTYSTYERGLDALWGMYQWLDRHHEDATRRKSGSAATTSTTAPEAGSRKGLSRAYPAAGGRPAFKPDTKIPKDKGARQHVLLRQGEQSVGARRVHGSVPVLSGGRWPGLMASDTVNGGR